MYIVRFNNSEKMSIPINTYEYSEQNFKITGICFKDNLFIELLKQIPSLNISYLEVFNEQSSISEWSSEEYNNASFITLSLASSSEDAFNFTFILNI